MNNRNNQNKYNTDINSTRAHNSHLQDMGINQNPYINQTMNQNPMTNNVSSQAQNTFSNADFVKGALIGAAVTFLLTNKGAQESIIKAASKGNELFQAGMEEMKERYEDAKAQMEATAE